MEARLIRLVLTIHVLGVLTVGCANQNSIFRVSDTENNKTETILIDAKQRPITVNTNKDKQKTCLARSADALSQAAASGNLKITQASGGSGELGFADNETVTSIAFRTQVTEAQQEFLYYLCQLNSNGVLTDREVAYNLTHFQNTMLAMVAIDDLANSTKTKPADAQKPPAATDDPKAAAVKKAQSGADAGKKAVATAAKKVDTDAKTVKTVKAAKDLKGPTDSLAASLKSYDAKQNSYATLLSKLSDAIKAQKGDDAKAPDDVTSATSDANDAAKDVKTSYKKAAASLFALAKITDDAKLAAAQADQAKTLSDYQDSVKQAQDAEGAQQKALTAWSGGSVDDKTKEAKSAKPGDQSGAADVSGAVPQAVTSIVQTIVWQSFVTEQCEKVMFENYNSTAAAVQRYCLSHLIKADEVREKQLLAALVTGNSKPQPQPQPQYLALDGGTASTPTDLYNWIDQGSIDQAKVDQIRSQQFTVDKGYIDQAKHEQDEANKAKDQALQQLQTLQQHVTQVEAQKAAAEAALKQQQGLKP